MIAHATTPEKLDVTNHKEWGWCAKAVYAFSGDRFWTWPSSLMPAAAAQAALRILPSFGASPGAKKFGLVSALVSHWLPLIGTN